MKSWYFTASYKVALVGVLSLSFAACNKDNAQQRRGLVAGGQPANISQSGIYQRGSGAQSLQCNINDTNPNSTTSPLDQQSPCFNPSTFNQAVAAGQIQPNQQAAQQNQVDPNGQPVNPSQAPNGNPPNVSVDITPEGKIVNRHFRLVGGVIQEDVTDNCNYYKLDTLDIHDDSYDPTLNTIRLRARFLQSNVDRFDLYFDPQGNLGVKAQTGDGQAWSKPGSPIPYTLNAADQSIKVDAFTLAGPASPQFVQNEKALGDRFGAAEHDSDKEIYDALDSSGRPTTPGVSNQNRANPGFVLGPQAGPNGSASGGYAAYPLAPTIDTPATAAISSPGFVGIISTWIIQPQHITEIRIPQIDYQSNTFVSAKPDVCQGTGSGHYYEVHLNPAQ
jgi:hypothetical protein